MKELYERTIFDVVEFENEDIVTDSYVDPTEPTKEDETPGMPI